MLNHLFIHKKVLVAMLLTFVSVSIVGCISPVPPDTTKEGISLKEAQELLPFKVCLPEYVPNGVKISETVRYHDEFGDPNESDVTIDYFDEGKENTVFTIYERHGPVGKLDFYNDSIKRISLRDLIAWQAGWSQVDSLQSQVDVEYEVYNHGLDRLVVEIEAPESQKAVLVRWALNEFVLIDIYSHLSVEETKLTADSMTDCNSIPTATP